MRTRLLALIAAAILAALGVTTPAAQAAVAIDGQMCTDGGGTVEYESTKNSWICVDGTHNGKSID
ncbi:hypothetical protein NRK68_09090 [Streptomyces yangpuensis]|uniref:Secreted protein n=1 Tax=Streptomyces yangpuensis TaxID=1648182 RepID=A0ABY5PUX4_9ACTN|nr:hypothetical protein [Streptomyces yangpuensis]UUY47358.1 hypothetical protein NRK68_09090 [Streptomyces yangpuensis]